MPVLFLIAIVVVLVGIFFAATGRGGEMSTESADHAPLDLGPVSAADIALLRPPTAMWGYNMQVTDEALDQIARAMRERDVTIAYLQDQLTGYGHNGSYAEPRDAPARQDLEAADAPGLAGVPEPSSALETPADPWSPENSWSQENSWSPESSWSPEDAQTPEDAQSPDDLLFWDDAESSPSPEDPPADPAPEAPDSLEILGLHEPPESPEPVVAEPSAAAAVPAPEPPRTALVLKASGTKQPEPHEVTQPPQTFTDPGEAHDATEPSAVLEDDEEPGEATRPSATVAPNEAPGPQGAFDTHGWWAEQQEAAHEEQVRRQGSGEHGDDSVTAAEEQGW